MRHLCVKRWDDFQHYKSGKNADASPMWIRLYTRLLDDYDFQQLRDETKAHLVLIWLLAARLDNRIPHDAGWIAKKIGARSPVAIRDLVIAGFLGEIDEDGKQAPRTDEIRVEEIRVEESKKRARPRFKPPTVDDVRAYCTERGNTIDPQRFVDHYTANGWVRGKTPIKDWQAAVRTWERNEIGKPAKAPAVGTSDPNEFKPWHAEDVRKHGGKNLHPQWNAYFDAMDAKYEPGEKWDRFDDWMKRNA